MAAHERQAARQGCVLVLFFVVCAALWACRTRAHPSCQQLHHPPKTKKTKKILIKVAELIEANLDEFAALEALDNGELAVCFVCCVAC